MDYQNIFLIFIAIGNLLLGLWVYRRDPQKKLNQAYSFLSLGIIAWTVALIFFRSTSTPESALEWARLLYLMPVGIVVSFVYFCSLGPYSNGILDIKEKLLWLIPSILMLIIIFWPNILLSYIVLPPGQEKIFFYGWGYLFYLVYVPSFFIWGYWLLYVRFYKNSNVLIKKQFMLIFLGLVLASVGGMVTNLALPTFSVTNFIWVGPLFTFFMLIFIAYGMKKYFLMYSKATAAAILKE